ncbi:MAG TPA: TIR domain-containing protein [Planctomycetota bacterium]|nr:TIR domain-containing protein [Planctomycetota bacterium]
MGHDVFISHSAEDKAVAQQVCDALEQGGIKCWVAPRDVMPGAMYGAAIVEAIGFSRAMVFIFSSHSNQSPHVLRELERAVSKGVSIVPFRTEDVQPSLSLEYFITSAHWLDAFRGPIEGHVHELVEAVRRLLAKGGDSAGAGAQASPAASSAPPQPPRQAPRPPSLTSPNEFERDLAQMELLLSRQDWCPSVRACGQLLEKATKKLLADAQSRSADPNLLARLRGAERHIGRGRRTVENFDLDEMLHLYSDTELFEELRRQLTSNLQMIRQVDWERLTLCYDESKDPRLSDRLRQDDASQVAYWTKLFLYDCELAGAKQVVDVVPEEERNLVACPVCGRETTQAWNYCPGCGSALKLICQACYRALAPAFRICPYCETRVQHQTTGQTDEHRRACEEYRVLCSGAYLDGVVNVRERELLDKKRLALGLNAAEAEETERRCAPPNVIDYARLVEGVLVDDTINDVERGFLTKRAEELGLDGWTARQVELVVMQSKGLAGPDACA